MSGASTSLPRVSPIPAGLTDVTQLPASEIAHISSSLRAMGAVLFGATSDGGFTTRARADLAPFLDDGSVLFVACDAGAEGAAACERAGITTTPTLLTAGGAHIEGAVGLRALGAFADAPAAVAAALSARGAHFYGRDSCVWTRRQKSALGVGAALLYVDCEDAARGAAKCRAAGVTAVPAWSLPSLGKGELQPGFRSVDALRAWLQ
jgi:hypothetical protein